MKIIIKLFLSVFFLFSIQILFSQSNQAEQNLAVLKKNEWNKDLTAFSNHEAFLQKEFHNLGLIQANDLRLYKTTETAGNWKHFRYQQTYKGLPVLTGMYILHEKNNTLYKANGNILPNIQVKTSPNYDAETALALAKDAALSDAESKHNGKIPSNLSFEVIENTTPRLVVADKQYPENSGKYTLAYIFDLEFNSFPPRRDQYVLDAFSGKTISIIPQVCHVNVEGTVKTKYYGDRTVTVDSISPNEFRLQDFTRGDGVVTESDLTDETVSDTDKYFDAENADQDEVAGDVHWCSTEYYDWLLKDFSWDGLDNEGHELRSVVHTGNGRSYVNAFWNGRFASFGDGDCVEYGPLTTLDVVSHEFTHGLTEFTSGLIYRNESGALNESMSDMFGKALEYYSDPANFTWKIGGGFVKSPDAESFRDMSDPNARNHPNFYKGQYWSDFGAVHTNSNVMNYWFYLLVEGGTGTNEADIDYDVPSIGMDKAMDIIFAVNTGYLVPNSTYLHAYESTVEVAGDLFGSGSAELASVKEAWKAVGIVVPDPFSLDKDLAINLLNKDSIICGIDAEIEISVAVINLSKDALPSGTELVLSFQLNSSVGSTITSENTETITLTQDFPVGDTLEYTFSEKMKVDGMTGFRDKIEVLIAEENEDEYAFNDSDLREVIITESGGTDLSLRVSRLSSTACSPDQLRFSFYLQNQGCDTVKANTEIEVDFTFNNETVTHQFFLPDDLPPDEGYSEIYFHDLNNGTPVGSLTYEGVLKFDSDENTENDESDRDTRIYQQTGSDYYENFSRFDIENDPYLVIDPSYNAIAQTVNYNGEEMLGMTGDDLDLPSVTPGCEILDNILEENFGFDTELEFCIDVTGLSNPTLSFDLVQFYDTNQVQFPEEFTSVFTVDLNTSAFDPIRIFGQNQGDIITRNISLPIDFDGKVNMAAFTLRGDQSLLDNNDFSQGNFILIDNIRISNGPVSTEELSSKKIFNVFPNPAKDAVSFENINENSKDYKVEIFNTIGKKITEIYSVAGKTKWNASEQQAGIYFYKISQNGQISDAGKLIIEK